jgi:hypothetical protein
VTFSVTATIQSLMGSVNRFYAEGKIDNADVYQSLMDKLTAAQNSSRTKTTINQKAFINLVKAQSGKHITADAAAVLIADAQWVIAHLR